MELLPQSYIPSCSQMSTRKSTISARGTGLRKGLLVPSKLSYVAFQLKLGSPTSCFLLVNLVFPFHWSLLWFQRRRPWFTNSIWLLLLPLPLCWWKVWFDVLIEEMLLWDWIALFSISHVLVLQKSSEMLGFLTVLPWILNPFEGSSTAIIGAGLVQHPRQPLLCYNSGLTYIQ